MVSIRIDCAPETLAHCLLFMYTGRTSDSQDVWMLLTQVTELGNIKSMPPYDKGHLPRCVLLYTCGVLLRIRELVVKVLEVVEETARQLSEIIKNHHENAQRGPILWALGFTEDHLLDALELIYEQPSQELMKPMRIVMAAVLDNSLLWLLQRPSFQKRIENDAWNRQMNHFLRDLVEYRILKQRLQNGSVIPGTSAIDEMLNRDAISRTDSLCF